MITFWSQWLVYHLCR